MDSAINILKQNMDEIRNVHERTEKSFREDPLSDGYGKPQVQFAIPSQYTPVH